MKDCINGTHNEPGRECSMWTPAWSRLAVLGLFAVALLSLGASSASASKQVIAYFGTDLGTGTLGGQFDNPGDVAVNASGVGVADEGEIYVVDNSNNRIQRFAQNDNGTPTNPYDDQYEFVSAWGAGVETGGSDYEICTVAANCGVGKSASGNGAFDEVKAIAIDEDTGDLFVVDASNVRVSVYSGDGTFLRSFGYDVVASGPGNTGTGYEICVAAAGDLCKAGVSGTNPGQIGATGFGAGGVAIAVSPGNGSPSSGTVFLTDRANHRVNTYGVDGSDPGNFGGPSDFGSPGGTTTGPGHVAVDSRGIVYVEANSGGLAPSQFIARYDSENANGGGVGFLSPIPIPPLLTGGGEQVSSGLEIDPDSDGAGPDTDVLYALRGGRGGEQAVVQQFGPVNKPGLSLAPTAADDEHGFIADISFSNNLGLDISTGRLFVTSSYIVNKELAKSGVYVLDTAGGIPAASLDSISDVSATGATVHATVDPNGPPTVSYRIEYSPNGSNWSSLQEVVVGTQEDPQAFEVRVEPPGGLTPDTEYFVRVVARKAFAPAVVTPPQSFSTAADAPGVETVGSPLRTATTAQLGGRVDPRNQPTTYHFEYGDQGPCDVSPCTSTADRAAGSDDRVKLVAEEIQGLAPGTTYHYRVVADNGNPGSPSAGADMTVTTRASDAPLSHGDFPGPSGSDRAWEQVNVPDTGGNPVVGGLAFSNSGNRAVYQVAGGTPISDVGTAFNQIFAERTAAGWTPKRILPGRENVKGPNWFPPAAAADLSTIVAFNFNVTSLIASLWRLTPGAGAAQLHESASGEYGGFYTASDDGSRAVMRLTGDVDPDHPAAPDSDYLYDVSSGTPEMASLLPNGSVPTCGIELPETNYSRRSRHWLTPDGSRLFFNTAGSESCLLPKELYMRDFAVDQTEWISGPPLSGSRCGGQLVKSTPDAVFFITPSRLDPDDRTPVGCAGSESDVYRYDFDTGERKCVTCLFDGYASGGGQAVVSDDGSRLYFVSQQRLTAGADTPGIYRVMVDSGNIAYVGPTLLGSFSEIAVSGNAITPDGSVFIFRSSNPDLNPLGDGSDNGGTDQYYRYDDRDRSLVCVSCPQDGHAATLSREMSLLKGFGSDQVGPNLTPLTDDGDFVFSTTEALVNADQNTARPGQQPFVGTDIYEWRDGRLYLVSDGLSNWPDSLVVPQVNGVSPSGQDVFFVAAARLTPDAPDGGQRLYDARIGGGFDFPVPPKPCPLEVCQGIPKGAPEESPPGTSAFSGPGNSSTAPARQRCSKPKRKVRRAGKVRCVKPKKKTKAKAKKANNHRRAAR